MTGSRYKCIIAGSVLTGTIMAVLDARPMQADDEDVATLRIFAARAAAELERRRQAVRVIEAADAERRRIGRDLHDGAQQRLMAVANFLTVARKKADGSDAASVLALAEQELSAANTVKPPDGQRTNAPVHPDRVPGAGHTRDSRPFASRTPRSRPESFAAPATSKRRCAKSAHAMGWLENVPVFFTR